MSVVLALSGGGAKAAAHIGALRALADAGIRPAHIVGTSMGAVVGAAAAAGVAPAEMLARVGRLTRKDVAAPARLAILGGLYLPALLLPEPLRRTIAALVPAERFGDLATPLTVTAVDLDSGALCVFGAHGGDAPLVDALYASCALPMYYPPAILDGRRYGDGGLRGALPLATALAVARAFERGGGAVEAIVAIDIGPGFDEEGAPPTGGLPTMVRAHDDATGILMAALAEAQRAEWAADPARPRLVHVRPRVERHATFRLDRVTAYEAEGYRAARAALATLP